MKQVLTRIKQGALDLWRDDSGAQMVEKILIVAAISIPLLGMLLFFSDEIKEWGSERWDQIRGKADSDNNPLDNPFGPL